MVLATWESGVPWCWRPGGLGLHNIGDLGVGGYMVLATWGSGVPWCWRLGGLGSGVQWCWRPGYLLAVPHCFVVPTRRQHHRLNHHACDLPDGTLCIGCCLDMQRRDGLSPSTWSRLSAVGQPSAVPCDTGDGLSPSTWSMLPAVGRPSAVLCDTGDGLSPSTWTRCPLWIGPRLFFVIQAMASLRAPGHVVRCGSALGCSL